jgi:hypothetical protein
MATNQPSSFVQDPIWDDATVQAQDKFGNIVPRQIDILPKSQFNTFIRNIQNAIQQVTGAGGNPASIQGPLSLNGNPITNVTNSSPPASNEALSAGTAASLYSTFRQTIKTVSGTYQSTSSDGTLKGDATAASFTITLPPPDTVTGYIFPVIKVDSSAHAVTVASANTSSGTAAQINGAATNVLSTQYAKAQYQSDGQNYFVVG